MDADEREVYEKQSQDLRLELKKWETQWARDHKGKKPSRNDIKQNPDIGKEPWPFVGAFSLIY